MNFTVPKNSIIEERCWGCNKVCSDEALGSSDDHLCQPCFDKNEDELESLNGRSTALKNGRITPITKRKTVAVRVPAARTAASSKTPQMEGNTKYGCTLLQPEAAKEVRVSLDKLSKS